jgi:hypothetical protein
MKMERLVHNDAMFQSSDEQKNLGLKSHLLGTVFEQSTVYSSDTPTTFKHA